MFARTRITETYDSINIVVSWIGCGFLGVLVNREFAE